MATLGKVQIADKNSAFDSGAAFLLLQKCDVNKTISILANQEVEVCKDNPYIIARIKGTSNASDTFNESHEVVQQALDILSAQGEAHLSTRNTQDECLLWWRGSSGQVLRMITVLPMSFTVGAVNITQLDRDGKVVPATPLPELKYHESLRYFRLSQASDDLFEAFRNIYLAFESLLAKVVPFPGRKEGKWLRKALTVANSIVPLTEAFKSTPSNVVDDIYDQLYEGIRCQIFHSKGGAHLVPQNIDDRKKVAEGLDKLVRLFLLLAKKFLNVRFASGGVTYEGFKLMYRSMIEGSTILVSDSDLPPKKEDSLESPAYQNAVDMKTKAAPELSEPGLDFILGNIDGVSLSPLARIGRVSVKNNDKLLMTITPDAELKHAGIDLLEAQLGVQLRNVRQPKHLYRA